MLTPWLMRSPPEASRKEVAPNFLTWKVSQPALRAAEPMEVGPCLLAHSQRPGNFPQRQPVRARPGCQPTVLHTGAARSLLRSWWRWGVGTIQGSQRCAPSWFQSPGCPVQVLLSVAQIDMVYSQYALLRLLAFLNDAYPPPNLDPLMVRASVTLNEIVRERLVGPRRPHQLQKHQQSQLSIQVTALRALAMTAIISALPGLQTGTGIVHTCMHCRAASSQPSSLL